MRLRKMAIAESRAPLALQNSANTTPEEYVRGRLGGRQRGCRALAVQAEGSLLWKSLALRCGAL